MVDQGVKVHWPDGNWKAMDGGHDVPIIKGDKIISLKRGSERVFGTLQHGSFGDADPETVETAGKTSYDVELRYGGQG